MEKKITLTLLIFLFFTKCNKKDEYINPSISFTDVEVLLMDNLVAFIKYDIIVKGNPSVRESGTIVTLDPEASYFNNKLIDDSTLELEKRLYFSVEAEKQFYVRPYVITFEDTLFGEIQSFMSGAYYKEGSGVTDASGNSYNTIILGGQEWMKENLRTTLFCNGDSIPFATNDSIYEEKMHDPLSVYFDYAQENSNTYGTMYNGHAVLDERNICPCGWRVPTLDDWNKLIIYLGNNKYVGGKMKTTGVLEEGTGLWENPNGRSNNLSGFSALPGGRQYGTQHFWYKNTHAYFAYIDDNTQSSIMSISINNTHGSIYFQGSYIFYSIYVRCVKED